jgi:energy-coupling factor transport system substrate-specific component
MNRKAQQMNGKRWRVVDITVASVIGVTSGLVFWLWDFICDPLCEMVGALTPGFNGLLNGFWLFAGPLAAVIVRKPGAALYGEMLASLVELTLGNSSGIRGFALGFFQGLGAELAFAIFAYKLWNVMTAMLSGALAGVGCGVFHWVINPGWGVLRSLTYVGTSIAGGAVCGLVCWLLARAIARTGVLSQFAYMRIERD